MRRQLSMLSAHETTSNNPGPTGIRIRRRLMSAFGARADIRKSEPLVEQLLAAIARPVAVLERERGGVASSKTVAERCPCRC